MTITAMKIRAKKQVVVLVFYFHLLGTQHENYTTPTVSGDTSLIKYAAVYSHNVINTRPNHFVTHTEDNSSLPLDINAETPALQLH